MCVTPLGVHIYRSSFVNCSFSFSIYTSLVLRLLAAAWACTSCGCVSCALVGVVCLNMNKLHYWIVSISKHLYTRERESRYATWCTKPSYCRPHELRVYYLLWYLILCCAQQLLLFNNILLQIMLLCAVCFRAWMRWLKIGDDLHCWLLVDFEMSQSSHRYVGNCLDASSNHAACWLNCC